MRWIKYILLLIIIVGCNESPVNWSPSFDSRVKIPYGTYVLKNELDTIFPYTPIEIINESPDTFLDEYSGDTANYIYIYPEILHSEETQDALMDLAYDGGVVFISSYQTFQFFHLETDSLPIVYNNMRERAYASNKTIFSINNNDLPPTNTTFKGLVESKYFVNLPDSTEVLGYLEYKNQKLPNFILIRYGDGAFIFHLEPYVFTNYAMLKSDYYKYSVNCLSYLNDNTLLWDNQSILRRHLYGNQEESMWAFLNFMWQNPALKMSLILLMIGGLLYIVLNSKRKQKPIPVISPFVNKSLEFSKSMSMLYSKTDNHFHLVRIKINHFLEKLRREYYLDTTYLNKELAHNLSKKTQININTCEDLISLMKEVTDKKYCSEKDFINISKKIEEFNKSLRRDIGFLV